MSKQNRNSVNMSLKDYHDKWTYYFSMLYHRTIYTHAAWNEHRSNFRHGQHLVRLAGFPLWPPITILTIYAAIVAGYNEIVEAHKSTWKVNVVHLPTIPLTFTAAALIILLGFRTTACYARFDEARKTWGGNLNRCRDLARQACTWMNSNEDELTRRYFIQYLKAYPYCMKENVEAEGRLQDELVQILSPDDLAAVLVSTHRPNHCIQVLSELLAKSHMSEIMKAFMSANITTFHDNVGICERLFKTPIPLSYTYLTSQFLVIWHLVLPIALWDSCRWIVVLATFLSAAALFCIDEVGMQIEEPFSILPLQAICDGINSNIDHICSAHQSIAKLPCLQEFTVVESLFKN